MNRYIAILALLLGLAAVADAACPRVVRQVVVTPVAQQILLPSYYPLQGQGSSADTELLRQMLEELRGLREELAGMKAGGLNMESVVKTQCASCHTEGKNPRKRFILVLADGKLNELSIFEKKLVEHKITTTDVKQRMPPERALSANQQRIVVEGLK